jgi:hypothetical protein
MQRGGVVAHVARVGICSVLDQQPQRGGVAHGLVQTRTTGGVTLPNETGIVRQQFAQRVDVSSRTRLKEPGDLRSTPTVDFGLQRSPARETVLSCERLMHVFRRDRMS